jgi:hypothetical protein
MLWKSLRWNWVNTWAIAAFCLLPFIGLASGNSGDGKTGAPVSLTQSHDDGVSIQTASFDDPLIASIALTPKTQALSDRALSVDYSAATSVGSVSMSSTTPSG